MADRTIQVDHLARVEGEGALTIRYEGAQVRELQLRIFEPPRFFEAFLVGRSILEAPDLTARICGICPVAYQMSACAAAEQALSVVVPPELLAWRRLLYCGEWIESHLLHMVLLHAPDFLGLPDAMAMAREHGDRVRAALRIKKAGNAIVGLLGGREIHPVNVRVGGFYKLPTRAPLLALADELEACLPLCVDLVRWLSTFDFPALAQDLEYVALAPPDRYPFIEGPLCSTRGLRIEAEQWPLHFDEVQVPHSTALHGARRAGAPGHGGLYLLGPLARFNLCSTRLAGPARALAGDLGLVPPVTNPFRSLLVRGVEAVHALDEAARLCRSVATDIDPAVPVTLRAGTGHGWSEAPRGTLYHRYIVDEQGLITSACIVPPTAQNQPAIEADLWTLAPELLAMDDAAATWRAEQAIRNYDPCISCATHFLTLTREPA